MIKRLAAFRGRGWRCAVALLLIAGCCAMWFPVRRTDSPGKDRSQPFPCMDRPCGCATADQCWKRCCCFTNQQKIVWAKRVGAAIPEFVVAAASKEAAAQKEKQVCTIVKPRCPHCRETPTTAVVTAETRKADADNDQPKTIRRRAARYVLGISALECQGLTTLWQILSSTILPDLLRPEIAGCEGGSFIAAFEFLMSGRDRPAPEPQPRIG